MTEVLVNVEPREAVILLSGLKTKLSPDNHDTISSRTFVSMNNDVTVSEVAMTIIKCALEMKANEITSKKMVRIAGFIPDFNVHNIRVSICCNWCGKPWENTVGQSYMCDSCNQYAVAMSKLFFGFSLTDGTGSLKLSAHTKNAEQLLRTKASAVHSMTTEVHTFKFHLIK
ncbi:hypothetical protein V2J09_013230 [Rumex salicifolius]